MTFSFIKDRNKLLWALQHPLIETPPPLIIYALLLLHKIPLTYVCFHHTQGFVLHFKAVISN